MRIYLALGLAVALLLLWVFALKAERDELVIELDSAAQEIERLGLAAAETEKKIQIRDEIDKKYSEELTDAKNEIDVLRADVAASRKRLLVKAVCPSLPSARGATGLDDGERAELNSAAREDYFQLRERVTRTESRLKGLQEYVRSVCLVKPDV